MYLACSRLLVCKPDKRLVDKLRPFVALSYLRQQGWLKIQIPLNG
jgi:hypothetical protein